MVLHGEPRAAGAVVCQSNHQLQNFDMGRHFFGPVVGGVIFEHGHQVVGPVKGELDTL